MSLSSSNHVTVTGRFATMCPHCSCIIMKYFVPSTLFEMTKQERQLRVPITNGFNKVTLLVHVTTESLECHRRHAFKSTFLRTLLRSNDFLTPGTIGKCSLERRHPFLTKVDLIMNRCFIQYNAAPTKHVKVAQKITSFFQVCLVISQIQINFIIFEV